MLNTHSFLSSPPKVPDVVHSRNAALKKAIPSYKGQFFWRNTRTHTCRFCYCPHSEIILGAALRCAQDQQGMPRSHPPSRNSCSQTRRAQCGTRNTRAQRPRRGEARRRGPNSPPGQGGSGNTRLPGLVVANDLVQSPERSGLSFPACRQRLLSRSTLASFNWSFRELGGRLSSARWPFLRPRTARSPAEAQSRSSALRARREGPSGGRLRDRRRVPAAIRRASGWSAAGSLTWARTLPARAFRSASLSG